MSVEVFDGNSIMIHERVPLPLLFLFIFPRHGGTKPLGVSICVFLLLHLIHAALSAPLVYLMQKTLMEAGCCLAVAANTAKLL